MTLLNQTTFDREEELYKNWAIVPSPVHIACILPLYLLFIYKIGPQFMEKRKPFELKRVIQVYNLLQVAVNIFLLVTYYSLMNGKPFTFWDDICFPVSAVHNFNPKAKEMLTNGMYFYYTNKIMDLIDTIFFTLRKKDSQITFLHVFHHITMIISTWVSIFIIREEISAIFAAVNSFIHVIMYSYYFLSSLGPSVQKHLWWKKHITKLQIAQFMLCLSCLGKIFYKGCQCNQLFWWIWSFNISVFLGLFSSFYLETYYKKSKKA